MNKKIFTLALLAVFVLAQFSIASAAVIAGATATIDPLPTFSQANAQHELVWSVTGMPATGNQFVNFWYRVSPTTTWSCIGPGPVNVTTLTNANGTFLTVAVPSADQSVVEFLATVDDVGCPASPSSSTPAMASTFTDGVDVNGFYSGPPNLDNNYYQADNHVACNTFEMWGIMSDGIGFDAANLGYSGLDGWNTSTTGTFAAPAPEGPNNELLSWVVTLPATANGNWSFMADPTDMVGNGYGTLYFRNALPIVPSELEDCTSFSDVSGHADEAYIRYLASLGLISGFADGTFGPDKTLTRAEASVLFEISNGYDAAGLPVSAPTGCDFTDVSATDWFAGWVWQACDDGFMNGIGGGLFDPNNLLTRGQIVTIINNIVENGYGDAGTYLANDGNVDSVLNDIWGDDGWSPLFNGHFVRETAWTDIYIGDYYAVPAIRAYGAGVVEGTSATTFSPNQPVLRGEFAKMLYRVLSATYD
jgi:hypothetical protein